MTTEEIKLLDEFAGRAMQAIITNPLGAQNGLKKPISVEECCRASYIFAKGMLLERQRILNALEEEV